MSEPAVAAASVGPGSILGGKYRLDRVLGSGAMGTVYAALHEKLGREVAIKVLNGELGKHDEAMQRFQREAELVTKLGHPNIVAVYDFGLSLSGAPYFVMEVVSGQTLRQRLERGPRCRRRRPRRWRRRRRTANWGTGWSRTRSRRTTASTR